MINIPWLPVEGETCGHKKKKSSKISCELPPNHKTEYVGGYIYPWHHGRDKLFRWRTWR